MSEVRECIQRAVESAPMALPQKTARPAAPASRRAWVDVLLCAGLAALAMTASFQGARRLDPVILEWESGDVWFEADIARVVANMTRRKSDHYRSSVHPLFALTAYPLVQAAEDALEVPTATAVRVVMASVAALWVMAFYLILRTVGRRRLDALLFTLLAASSAFAVFWFTVPETYPFGSLTILIALLTAAAAGRWRLGSAWFIPASVLSLSFTVTNWMAGIAAAFASLRPRRAALVTAIALAVVTALWIAQKRMFPRMSLIPAVAGETNYVLRPESGGPFTVAKSFIYHSVLMPEIEERHRHDREDWPIMVTQSAAPGSGSIWGTIGAFFWTVLLILGACGLLLARDHSRFRLVLLGVLGGQFLLHALYGEETFLYSCHFGPLLVILAAFGASTRARPAALGLAGTVTFCAILNNTGQFEKAAEFLRTHGTPRHRVLSAMKARPDDPWPRGDGHVILARPGSRLEDKAYHEPGGSFSPAPRTFGVSIWASDAGGRIVRTSDGYPLAEVRQELIWKSPDGLPSVRTETPRYEAIWSPDGPGRWRLDLESRGGGRSMIAVREAGPAGGYVRALEWDGRRLLINGAWKMTVEPAPAETHLGEEGIRGWKEARTGLHRWNDEAGGGYARLVLEDPRTTVVLEAPSPPPEPEIPASGARAAIELDLPDPAFTACLHAQAAHLLMGTVGRETRSSDPVNVPVPWQRTGSYIIAALAAAGQLDAARELSRFPAENDFYGGFGAEADAPGLGLWAIEEVASRLASAEYDRWVWPHAKRKAEWILRLASTKEPIHATVANPVVPKYADQPDITLIAEPPRDGLILGRMDSHRPALYITAVSHRGLIDAASLAERVGASAEAALWRAKAGELQAAWTRALPTEPPNDRTFTTGTWPTWVASASPEGFRKVLEARWTSLHDENGAPRARPLWTYFEVAVAHQWLFLGAPERTWSTLRWFQENQASPGLYTWWEDKNEGNAYGGWESIHGWVKPPSSQPHYWTNAEMLLLLIDMLAYVDEGGAAPVLVIGAGVPGTWMGRPMSVKGIRTRLGPVDWNWKDGGMRVSLGGRRRDVRLGSAFPAGAPVTLEAAGGR